MRSYGQYCALAKALDVIGDRWSLLIVRELLLRERCRYTDLREGLPGIATNLLAERLRELERLGVIEREDAPPLGEDSGHDAFRGHWLALPLEIRLGDRIPEGPPITIGLRTGEEALVVELADGGVRTRAWSADAPDVTLSGSPRLMVGVLTGQVALEEARARGLEWEGDIEPLRRILAEPAPERTATAAGAGAVATFFFSGARGRRGAGGPARASPPGLGT